MTWNLIELGDHISIKHGFAFKSKYFSDNGGYVVLTPGNCHENGGLKRKGEKEKSYIGEPPSEFILNEGDQIVVMTDLVQEAPILGGCFQIPEANKYLHNQRLGLVKINNDNVLNPDFLYYLFNFSAYRAQVRASASGSTVRHTSPRRIYQCKVWVPSVKEQEEIAKTLGSYDDLIENNRRRIELLAESARLLYREWFVHLRFPGHEHVKVVDGVPEGWERKPLEEITKLHYGKALKEQDRITGPAPVYGSSGEVGTHEKGLVPGPGIVVGRKGTVGSVFWVDRDFWPIDTVYYVEPDDVSFSLFYVLSHIPFVSSDAAVPGLNRKFAYSRPVLWPSAYLRDQFEEYVADMSAQISNLKRQNKKLAEARDLLLPRLMNGEIAV